MFAFLKRSVLVIVGFLLIALFIWYAGPYFAFGNYRPLESEFARLIAIALVVGFWFLSALVRKLRAFRASDRLLAAVVARPKAEPERPSAEAAKLRERFEEAVTALKQQRRSGHSLYDLPWYVIIGAPGSGKTTALMNSGLTFPLEQRVGKGALRGVGGTRNCDWWFTDEAIFLDTAGRYTTQDSDANSDASGWAEFLALLRTYRARRPINGVILTLNAQDLMMQGDAAREAHVEAARRRLNELNRELGIQLPVYLLVTKCDLVAGFTEYFDDLSPDGRRQVWGVTFPYEQTLSNEAAQVYPAEFDALMARLNEHVFTRVEEVRDVRRRTRIFAFPQQMAALRDALTQFVSEVFAATRFDQQILLRGVYFTSGTQDGTPIDRLLAGIGRRFGVTPDVIAPASGAGKAYFVERLLMDVMIGESGLAGINRRLEARKAAAQLGAYAAIAALAVLGVLVWTISYNRNRGYLEQAAADVAALRKLPPAPPTAPLDNLRPRLDALRALVASAERYRESTPLTMRWGLYQGRAIGNAARDAYVRELDGTLLPRVAARIQSRLVEYLTQPRGSLHLSEGVSDARQSAAPGQRASEADGGARVDQSEGRLARGGPRDVRPFPEPARLRRHAAAAGVGSAVDRPGAQQHSTGLDSANHLQRYQAHLRGRSTQDQPGRRDRRRQRSGLPAAQRCQHGRAAAGAVQPARSSKKSPPSVVRRCSRTSPTIAGCGAKARPLCSMCLG